MINFFRKTAIGLGIAGTLVVAVATPSLAWVVHVDHGHGRQINSGPYGGSGSRSWDYPAGDDIGVC